MDRVGTGNKNNVGITRGLGLCTSCGVCRSTCPENAINFVTVSGQSLPSIDEQKCIECGRCWKVCPGKGIDHDKLGIDLGGDDLLFAGTSLSCYRGYAVDNNIRKNATSGGMVTTLMTELLLKGDYQGCFVLPGVDSVNPVTALSYTESCDEIISCARSKYLPASQEKTAAHIKKSPDSKIIVVATPCQLTAILSFLKIHNISRDNILFLGLFCDLTMNLNFLEYYRKFILKEPDLKSFDYRYKNSAGWPGNTRIRGDKPEDKMVDRRVRLILKRFFRLQRCLYCVDKINPGADISLGDCYEKGHETTLGQSSIIVRTAKGEKAISRCVDKLVMQPTTLESIVGSQQLKKKLKHLQYADLFAKDNNGHLIYPKLQPCSGEPEENYERYQHLLAKLGLGMHLNNLEGIRQEISRNKRRNTLGRIANKLRDMIGKTR